MKKIISVLTGMVLMGGMLVGCSTTPDDMSYYLTEEGKAVIKESKGYDYVEIKDVDLDGFADQYGRTGTNVKVTGKVKDVYFAEENFEIEFIYTHNGWDYEINVVLPKNQCDIELITKGNTPKNSKDVKKMLDEPITIYGEYFYFGATKSQEKNPHHINAYFVEKEN